MKDSGTVSLTTVAVNDPKAGVVSCPATSLAPGVSTTCTSGSYTITQADVDAGLVTNTATATAKNPSGSVVTSNSSSTTTPVVQSSTLQLTKSAAVNDVNADGKTNLGDKVTWSFLVTNTGTTTLNTVAVSDATAGVVTCPGGTLAPGASTTCTSGAHPVSQADVDAGVVSNTATASAKNPGGGSVTSNPSSTDTPIFQSTGLSLTKSAAVTDLNGNGQTDLGDKITWSFLVKNTGTTTVNTVAVADPKAGAVSCPVTTLAPGVSTTCTSAAYTITQPDVDATHVANTATASAKSPSGGALSSPPSSTDTLVAQSPGLTLTKSAATLDTNGDFKVDLGDTITWSFLVKNTGTTTVNAIAVNDAKAGAVSCPVTTLAPSASTTCTATTPYPITQADVDAGVVSNTATASGTTPGGSPVISPPSSTDTTIFQAAGLSLAKSAAVTDLNADGKTDLGDTIAWSFLVKNTGTTTVNTVAVADPKAGAVSCPVTTLAPGASTTCTSAAYTITQPDVDAAHVANTATASAKTPSGSTLTSPPSSTDTPVAQTPGLSVTKSAAVTDVDGDGKTDLGDKIAWSFLVKNTGSVSVTAVAVSDAKAGAVSCPVTTLAPGGSTTCTATTAYVITQADVDAGVVSNTATASAKDPSGTAVPAPPSSTDTTVNQASTLTLVKSASVADVNADGRPDLGDKISWTFKVTNSGNTTLSSLAVLDSMAGARPARSRRWRRVRRRPAPARRATRSPNPMSMPVRWTTRRRPRPPRPPARPSPQTPRPFRRGWPNGPTRR